MSKTTKEIDNMELHQIKHFDNFKVMRVHNGWVYIFEATRFCQGVGHQFSMTSVFVPNYT